MQWPSTQRETVSHTHLHSDPAHKERWCHIHCTVIQHTKREGCLKFSQMSCLECIYKLLLHCHHFHLLQDTPTGKASLKSLGLSLSLLTGTGGQGKHSYRLMQITSRLLGIIGDYWRVLGITGDHWGIIGITVDYWRLLEICDSHKTWWQSTKCRITGGSEVAPQVHSVCEPEEDNIDTYCKVSSDRR